jgi:hypothetical protein
MKIDGKIGVPMRLFIGGQKVGGDSTFMDFYPDLATAIAETKAFYEADGFDVDGIEIQPLPRWEGTEPEPTLVVHLTKISGSQS